MTSLLEFDATLYGTFHQKISDLTITVQYIKKNNQLILESCGMTCDSWVMFNRIPSMTTWMLGGIIPLSTLSFRSKEWDSYRYQLKRFRTHSHNWRTINWSLLKIWTCWWVYLLANFSAHLTQTRQLVGYCIYSSAIPHAGLGMSMCYDFRRLRQSSTVVVSKVWNQMSLEEYKSWTCIVLLGWRAKVRVKGLSIKD